ncbi:MAG TPA: helix-turn-helix domain-containing protein [Solirubrobacterales bacterium]|nr:helix-turn-helix domain-containing protein [Solirubrobacterales bacterium]
MVRLPRHLSRGPVGREQLSREALVTYQRERILSAAIGVFAKRGYQQTTVENIVAGWDGSIGTFYQHFEGKEECFLGAFDRVTTATRGQLSTTTAAEESWAGQAYAGLAALLEAIVARPSEARLVLIEAQTAGPAANDRYLAVLGEIAAWLRRGRLHHSEAASLPESFEQAAVSGTAYFLRRRLLAPEPDSATKLLTETSRIVLEPMVGAAEVRRLDSVVALAS